MRNAIKLLGFSFIKASLIATGYANVHFVTNTNDSGTGSLRDIASTIASGDTIRFDPSLIANGSDTIVLTSGEIDFGNKSVVIIGLYNDSDTLYISGNNNSRIFSFSSAGKVVLDSVVLINGNGTGAQSNTNGGAILYYNSTDTLHIINSVIRNNTAGGSGGGIYASSSLSFSTIEIYNSVISNNTADTWGGGIYLEVTSTQASSSSILIRNSKVTGNTSTTSHGGGIYSRAYSNQSLSTSIVRVENSLVSNNASGFYGGGIFVVSARSIVNVHYSTISNNTANTSGGGIYCTSFPGNTTTDSATSRVYVEYSTISNNSSNTDGGGIFSSANAFSSYGRSIANSFVNVRYSTINSNTCGGLGGGIYSKAASDSANSVSSTTVIASTITGNNANSGTGAGGAMYSYAYSGTATASSLMNIANSTIFGNLAYSGLYTDANSTNSISRINTTSSIIANFSTNTNIDNTQAPTIVSGGYNIFSDNPNGATTNDQTNVTQTQINLQPLQYNGGFTKTMLPGPGSIAINQGNPSDMSPAQNGRICDGRRDIGAAETGLSFSILNITACNDYISPSGKYVWTESGTYMDTIQNSIGCDSVITINLTIVPVDTSVSINGTTLISHASNATFQWVECPSMAPIQGATDSVFTPTQNGSYAVIISLSSCSDTSACYYVQVTNVETSSKSNDIVIIHNTTSNNLIIKYNSTEISITSLRITDLSGKIIHRQQIRQDKYITIPIPELSSGLYILTLFDKTNRIASFKFKVDR